MMKEIFKNWIYKIDNPVWRDACLKLIPLIPDYFWTVPASSSGKYHPECDLGEGGLVRHSIMVTKIGLDLLESGMFMKDSYRNRDLMIITGLFHDVIKQGFEGSGHTEFEHPEFAADFLMDNLDIPDTGYKLVICDAVRSHMGKWNTSQYSDITLKTPQSQFEKLVHTADYIASRKYIAGLEDWN